MKDQALWIGNDHGGYELKLKIIAHLKEQDISILDVGSDSTEIVRYPYYAARVAKAISRGEANRGILICSTGIGMSIMANKFEGTARKKSCPSRSYGVCCPIYLMY